MYNNTMLLPWRSPYRLVTGKRMSHVSMYVAFLPLPVLGTVNFVTVGSFTISNQLVAGSIMVRHMKWILVLSLPLRVYCLMMLSRDLLWSALMVNDHTFGCVFCFWQDLQDFDVWLDGIVLTFPVYHGSNCLCKTWLARVLEVMVIPIDCPML